MGSSNGCTDVCMLQGRLCRVNKCEQKVALILGGVPTELTDAEIVAEVAAITGPFVLLETKRTAADRKCTGTRHSFKRG